MSDCEINRTCNAPCTCNNEYNLNIPQTQTSNAPVITAQTIKVEFGEVQTGRQKSLHIPFTNNDYEKKIYHVKDNPDTVLIYQFFTCPKKQFSLGPFKTISLKLVYKPLLALSLDFDVIYVYDNEGQETRIEMTGTSVGPVMEISSCLLKFNTWPGKTSATKTVELKNFSSFPVEFVFDIDHQSVRSDRAIFYVQPEYGVVEAHRHAMIHITFKAGHFGQYSQRLFCTSSNSYPLSVECFGVYWKHQELVGSVRFLNKPEVCHFMQDRYMFDVQAVSNRKWALFSFIECYLNFGSLELGQKNQATMITTLTNNKEQTVFAKCYPDEIFSITPTEIEIPPKGSVLFECNFCPLEPNKIYSRQLLFNIFTDTDPRSKEKREVDVMPIPALLRVLGNTFAEKKFWIPQITISPSCLIIPPALPGERSSATMEIRSTGHLPTSYHFVPPTASLFLVKPMMGAVLGLTIFAVQLANAATGEKNRLHQEQWYIVLNNDEKHRVPICFKCYLEYPSILVGDNNTVTIKGVQIDCDEVIIVPIKNTSQHQIFYDFEVKELPPEIVINNPKGMILSKATNSLNVSFKSSTRISKQFAVTCNVYAMKKVKVVFGKPCEVTVTFIVEADYSELCSIPTNWNFGTIECNTEHSTEFCMYNYGHTTVHYKLTIYSRHLMDDMHHQDTAIVLPEFGSLQAKAHVHCRIYFNPHDTGDQYACVYYEQRRNANATEGIENAQKLIFEFSASVINPYIQIIEIADHNFGPLFSKRTLWECLNINWLNYALTDAQSGASQPIDLRLPDAEMGDALFYVDLLVKNVTPFPVRVALKRRKLCDCQLTEVSAALSIRRQVYQCPHRRMCTLTPAEAAILPGAIQTLTLNVSYICAGLGTLSYDLSMNNHLITLNFQMRAIPKDTIWLSKYHTTYTMILQSICMKLKHPSIHVFHFYNNTSNPVSYEVSIKEFERINDNYRFQVWKCLNPTGTVNKYESYPLYIKQQPVDRRRIRLRVPLVINNTDSFTISINGRGSRTSNLRNIPKLYLPRAVSPEVPVHLSMDRLRIRSFPAWSTTTRMIFITNMSNDILGYNWIKTEVAGLCSVDVIDPDRVLRPKQTDMLIVRVTSFDKACTTRVHLPCQLISHTKYLQHQKTLQAYARREMEIKDEFIITEHGITYPQNCEVIFPKPRLFYTTLALELEITGFVDRDVQYTPQEQLKMDVHGILPNSIETLPKKSEKLEKPGSNDSSLQQPNPSNSINMDEMCEESPYSFNAETQNGDFYRDVIQALLADAIFSENFREVLNVQKRAPPIYYTQIKPRINEETDNLTHIKDMYNEPQMPFVKQVMHTMLLDSFDEIFQLKSAKNKNIDYNSEVILPNVCQCVSVTPEESLT